MMGKTRTKIMKKKMLNIRGKGQEGSKGRS